MSTCYRRVNFYDLCRLCAQSIQDNKIKIFDQKGQEIQLQSKIKKCLSMSINEDDFLPKVVCPRCIDQLEICNAFREECHKSEKMLSSYFKNYRHTEDFKKSGKVYIKDTARNDIASKSPKCKMDLVNKETKIDADTKKSNIIQSVKQQHSPSQIRNQSKKLKSKDTLTSTIFPTSPHIQIPYSIDLLNESLKKAVQQLPKDVISKVIVNANGEVINLPQSDVIAIDPINIPTNVIIGVNNIVKNRNSKGNLEKVSKEPFIANHNMVKIDLTSENVKEEPLNKFNFESLVKTAEIGSPVVQNTSVIFPISQYQSNFITTQPPNTSFQQSSGSNLNSASPNIISVSNNDPTNTDHNLPLSSISQEPPSSINMDDLRPASTFIRKPNQSKNEDSKANGTKDENGLKTHICEVCSKSFKRREHLYQHYKLHSSLRPYRCVECNKSFVRKEHLIRHMVLHSGERNFTCEICKKSFSRHDNLLKHIRTHNKDSTYTCEVCQRIFVFKHYLDVHRSEQGKCYLPPQVRAC